MIKCENGAVLISGNADVIMADCTVILKAICEKLPRDFVMPSLLSTFYTTSYIKSNKEGKIDLKRSIEDFKEDSLQALKYMGMYTGVDGKSIEDATEELKKIKESLGGEDDE